MRRTTRIQVYCHPDEKAAIEAMAREQRISASKYLRNLPLKYIKAAKPDRQPPLPIEDEI